MEILAFKDKSRFPVVLTFDHSDLNILNQRSPYLKTQFFWIPSSKTYQPTKFKQKISSYERDDVSKTTHKLCQQIGFVKKQVQLTSQTSKPTCQLFIHMEKVFIWVN